MRNLAPIVLFVYNRPDHTIQTIEALKKNELAYDSELFIYSDGMKNHDDSLKVNQVRAYIKNIDGFKNVSVYEREKNWGLANSIIDGVTNVINNYGKIIVLEDDIVTSKNFIKFMNNALDFYKDEENVYSITGYSYTDDIVEMSETDSTYFLKLISSWSWGTWASKWEIFHRDKKELERIANGNDIQKKQFNYDNSMNFVDMVKYQLAGKIDSWAIYWYVSVYNRNGLTLYPQKKLIKNIGFDGSGTHCGITDQNNDLTEFFPKLTYDIIEKLKIREKVVSNLIKINKPNFITRVLRFIKRKLS